MIRWVRAGAGFEPAEVVLGIVLLCMATLAFVVTTSTIADVLAFERRPSRGLVGDGPGVFEGTLVAAEASTTPTARRGAAWFARSEARSGGRRPVTCTATDFDGVVLRDGRGREARLAMDRRQPRHAGAVFGDAPAGSLAIASDEPLRGDSIPAHWAAECSCGAGASQSAPSTSRSSSKRARRS